MEMSIFIFILINTAKKKDPHDGDLIHENIMIFN